MTMTLDIYLSFVVAATILIIIPGPTVLTILSHGLSHGATRTLKTIAGAALAHLFYISITAVGVNEILMMSLKYFIIIKWLGIAYLTFIGLQKILRPQPLMPRKDRKAGKQKLRPLFFQGFIVTFSNPKTILFYAAFFPPFLNVNAPLTPQYSILGSTFLGLFFAFSMITAITAHHGARWLMKKGNYASLMEKVSGGMMIGAGILLASIKSTSK